MGKAEEYQVLKNQSKTLQISKSCTSSTGKTCWL